MKQTVNFTPLELTESSKRRDKYAALKPMNARHTGLAWLRILAYILGGIIILSILLTVSVIILGPFSVIIFPAAMIALIVYSKKRDGRNSRAFVEFVVTNQWKEGGKLPEVKLLSSNIKILTGYAEMHGEIAGKAFWLYKTFNDDIENGANRAQILTMTIDMQSALPTVFISARNQQLFGLNFKRDFIKKLQLLPIQLEGDFDQYLQLYSPANRQIETLSYITPDVMQSLINECWMLSVEFSDHYINLSCPYLGLTYTPVKQMLTGAQALIQQHKEKHA